MLLVLYTSILYVHIHMYMYITYTANVRALI